MMTGPNVGDVLLSGLATGGWLPGTHWLVPASAAATFTSVTVTVSSRKPAPLAAPSSPYSRLRRIGWPATVPEPSAPAVNVLGAQVCMESAQPTWFVMPQDEKLPALAL